MVRGRGAADGAMITSFGSYELKLFRVWTNEVGQGDCGGHLPDLLGRLPDAPALTLAAAGTS